MGYGCIIKLQPDYSLESLFSGCCFFALVTLVSKMRLLELLFSLTNSNVDFTNGTETHLKHEVSFIKHILKVRMSFFVISKGLFKFPTLCECKSCEDHLKISLQFPLNCETEIMFYIQNSYVLFFSTFKSK